MNQNNETHKKRGPSSCVRFSDKEYDKLVNDERVTGKSIPDLLKSAYFVGPPLRPLMEAAEAKATQRQLNQIGNNINQIARHLNSGFREGVNTTFIEVCEQLTQIRRYLGGLCGVHKSTL